MAVITDNYYEYNVTSDSAKSYYYAGAVRIAMRDGGGDLHWLLGDHLGSTSVVLLRARYSVETLNLNIRI